jgi:hypothetical protein
VDSVSQWCAVLFRTAVATAGMAALKTNFDPGIGTDSAKVVADCIHSSNVKEIGLALLKNSSELSEEKSNVDLLPDYDRLSEDEIKKLQLKLARLIVAFIELLHLLIARNRDMLLDVIQERKKTSEQGGGIPSSTGSHGRGYKHATSMGRASSDQGTRKHHGSLDVGSKHRRTDTGTTKSTQVKHGHAVSDDQHSYQSMMSSTGVRTDSAIAVQSELQRAFINLTKTLYPRVHGIMRAETPRWLKQCAQDNYFSRGTYRQTKIPIAEELCFNASDSSERDETIAQNRENFGRLVHLTQHSEPGELSPRGSVASLGGASQSSVISHGSARFSYGQF